MLWLKQTPDFGGAALRRWPTSGVMLESVAPDGAGARAGLRPGDVVVGAGGTPIIDTAGFIAGLRSAPKGGTVALQIDRGATPIDIEVPAGTLGIRIAKEPPATAGPKLAARLTKRSSARHGKLAPLPGSRAEIEAIAKAYKQARPQAEVRVLLGPDATEAGLVEAVHGARVLHLATHGLVDEGGSASFSALALTKPRMPVPGDDGYLTFADLLGRWRTRLKNAELVVLSACDSQRGRLEADEGMLSLPLGFSFAGCPRVIGSLWRVDDEATALLMASFYRRWLAAPQSGAAAALQAARRDLKKTHPDPHHWAPFVLLGDAR